uniref:GLOBIN domain-containing protein n=1 Tax=Angiostrongylus cantonensis TaxID=6313 RepID=A0A158PAZ6_ANGCA
MFTHHRHLRHYFKGAEAYTAEDIQKSERFADQGQRTLLAIYLLADTFDDEQAFRACVREVVNRHRDFQMDPEVWSDFFTVFVEFLEFREALTDEQKVAWKQLSKVFNEECQSHLKELGIPHVYFFTNHPDLRVYFKGAENYTADDVQKSDRLAIGYLIKELMLRYFRETTFRAYVRDTMDRHVPLKIDPTLWGKFFCIFVSFLETRGAVSDDQKAAWKQLGDMFIEESQSHLRACGLPHA